MKLLLDENLPKRLKNDFREFEIYTIANLGWNGVTNGKLLQLMIANGFNVFLTFDQNLPYQQNFQKYPITVFILVAMNNTYLELTKLSSKVLDYLSKNSLPAGPIIITA